MTDHATHIKVTMQFNDGSRDLDMLTMDKDKAVEFLAENGIEAESAKQLVGDRWDDIQRGEEYRCSDNFFNASQEAITDGWRPTYVDFDQA